MSAPNGSTIHLRERFSEIPNNIFIPVTTDEEYDQEDGPAVVELDRDGLPEDPTELCTLLENEQSPRKFWMQIALAYARLRRLDTAIEIIKQGIPHQTSDQEKLPMLHCLTYLFLERSRTAPANAEPGSAEQTKQHFLQLATQTINEAARIDPSSPLVTLTTGIFAIFQSSTPNSTERTHKLDTALRSFDRVIQQASKRGNMLATMGKARVLYGKKRYEQALACYQEVLQKRPDMDPDPRIGIGLCFWQLGHKEDAQKAWARALELNPDSKVANVLMTEYYLHVTSTIPEHEPDFAINYKNAINHTQRAYKADKNLAIANSAFATHFLAKKGFPQCESLAKKATQYSDVPAISSDAYFTLARKFHAEGNHQEAFANYRKSDQAREGGWLPAKLGVGQVQILLQDISGAKLTFEGIFQEHPKCVEAKTVLGTLYANEVLSSIPRSGFTASKDDISELHRKAISLLDSVRNTWKADNTIDPAHETILLTLSRLYEHDQPEKSRQCLEQVEKMHIAAAESAEGDEDTPPAVPLQLINNMAVMCWNQGQYEKARELYQRALSGIPQLKLQDETADTDALATTLTYNLARCEEAAGNLDEAITQYEKILQHHEHYIDANMRLAYIFAKRHGVNSEAAQSKITLLMSTEGNNLEVRALYAWFLNRQRRKSPTNIGEDPEQRHFKHTLQTHDKHDRYSLIGMGNIYLMAAREMRRETDAEKEKRRKTYEKAVEFFDKALQLDPKNAYAAQGIAIAMVEDKRDLRGAVSIFNSVRDTLSNDVHAVINLGHCLAGLEQWGRATEMYETAINKFNQGRDPNLLAAIGRVWYVRGKREAHKNPKEAYEHINTALKYAKDALELAKESPIFMFNVAFLQSELVNQIMLLKETQRNVAIMEAAAIELDEAVKSFLALSTNTHPPYPPKELEARANLSRTMRKQLDRRIASQREYETTTSARLASARAQREKEIAAEQEARRRKQEADEEKKRKIAEERRRLVEEAREFAARKAEEELEREERDATRKRGRTEGRNKRGPKRDVVDSDDDDLGAGYESDNRSRSRSRSEAAEPRKRKKSGETPGKKKEPPRKKKKLTRGGASSGKYKSKDTIDSADEEALDDLDSLDEDDAGMPPSSSAPGPAEKSGAEDDEEMEAVTSTARRGKKRVVDDDEEDEIEDKDVDMGDAPPVPQDDEED